MKKIFTSEFIAQIFLQFIILGLFMTCVQYKLAPLTAAEILKQQNYISSKKDIYFEAINLVTRELSGYNFHVLPDTTKNYARIKGTTLPTEFEINSCLNKLYLFSNNETIINSFKKNFAKGYNPIEQNIIMVKAIRLDLGGDGISMLNDYQYVQISRDTTLK